MIRRSTRSIARLLRDCRGAAALEFSLVATPLMVLLIGSIELAIAAFIGSTLESAVLEASRFGVTGATIPGVSRIERVREVIRDRTIGLVDMDRVEIKTLIYPSFADIGRPEPFTDSNRNGVYNAGEPFTDVNGNGQWDADMGKAGLGGPGDVVIYRITYDWGIITPLMNRVIGPVLRQTASVAVRNEPF